ncbi:UDP-N-acetylmuramoylalanine--D-glutamate ligase [Bdellovibrio bacteriovorus]|uniref:UDP-N-acetylmuramoylalanine--D-glutamate ligase n=2 Tax=Bdellovibrio bacteriovorus TaxID=959 RepID=A0A150WR30_BDEBC|nr:UDP-N-acetylmuramoyl-L-alanine--D-glutamate ligase [Bdellovibrio bacteriovorus]KYG66759.1 UDP-N-acetylmuramoylalanine--D-glutamate ligase [Bdellovibrio bacteriovorus]
MILEMSTFIKNLKTPIAIVGMARSGEAAKQLLLLNGVDPSLILTFDTKLPTANFNDPQVLMDQGKPMTLVVSPGVPLGLDWIQRAKTTGVKITSELSLACSCLESEKIIGVTGSVGKSTTVSLIGAGLQAFSSSGFVGGNLGIPFSQYAVEVLEGKRSRADWVVLELSSYQLENCENLRLEFSAITYLTSNHLERYDSLEDYYQTKWNILSMTAKNMFLNSGGGDLVSYSEKNASPKVRVVSKDDVLLKSLHLEEARLIGKHNQDNLALAATIALAAGWPQKAFDGMKNFGGLVHRLENVGNFKSIRFINDSKATAMDSVLIAAEAAHQTKEKNGRMFMLLGGRNKSLPWQDLASLKNYSDCVFVFFGECRDLAKEKSGLPGSSYEKLGEALDHVFKEARAGDTVLLSPGGTSWDEFKSFEDRGDFFKSRVKLFAEV